jgi:hypothetical protein
MPLNPNDNFNIFDFRRTVGDPARPFLFLVHIPEIGTQTVTTTLARSTELPAYTLGEIPLPFQGINAKLAGTPTFNDWTVNFLCDEAHELRRLFFKWQSIAYDVGTGLLGHSNSYKSDQVGCAQLARNGERVAQYGFVGAWPKVVGQIAVGHDQTGSVEAFDVTFAYDYFIMVDGFGTQTTKGSMIRSNKSTKINRGAPPPAGQWKTPFNPQ